MSDRSRVLFVGNVQASEVALRAILGISSTEVVAIVTKKASAYNSDHRDLSDIAEQFRIPWRHVRDINASHIHEWIRHFAPEVLFVSGWSQLLSPDTLRLAPKGAIGFHPALLPNNRGRHPLIWALVLGLEETGSTFFVMDEEADKGGILSQEHVSIDERETAASLYYKIEETMKRQIPQFLPEYLSGVLTPRPQTEQGNAWRKRSRQDGLVDFRMSTDAIDRLVRALSPPYPGAEVRLGEHQYIVTEATPALESYSRNNEPGKVMHIDAQSREITVKTGDGAIVLREHAIPELPDVGTYFL